MFSRTLHHARHVTTIRTGGNQQGTLSQRHDMLTNDIARSQSNLHKSSTNLSTTHSCAVSHLCRVDRHLSVLTRTSCVASFKQLKAQAVSDDNSFCEAPLVHYSLFHYAELKNAVLKQGEGFQDHQARRRRGRDVLPGKGPEARRGRSRSRNTATPKVFYEDMSSTSLTQTTKRSCEPQTRPAAARCMMARCGIDRGSP